MQRTADAALREAGPTTCITDQPVRVARPCCRPDPARARAQTGELFDYIVEKGRLLEDEARHFFQQVRPAAARARHPCRARGPDMSRAAVQSPGLVPAGML